MPDIVQRIIAGLVLVGLSPVLAVLALAIRLDSDGPVLYRARRIGSGARPFICLKLRTMSWNPAGAGLPLTVAGDPRVTRMGRLLRSVRLDEIPQLLNVVRGELRLVGPRPEEERYVDLSDPLHRLVFTATPGITGLAQIFFLDEADQLRGPDPEKIYRTEVLPRKLALDARYLTNRSTVLDLRILLATASGIVGRRPSPAIVDRWAPRSTGLAR